MPTTEYAVTGLTCDHCSRAIIQELTEIPGVTGVEVQVVPGGASRVRVESEQEISREKIEAGLAEAGDEYALTND